MTMERKTQVTAGKGAQDILITREFDLPVGLLFKAYTEAEFFEQWMGTKVTLFDIKKQGAYRFETYGPDGAVVFAANGTVHECSAPQRIIRTFEMENTPFPVQLEFLDFEALTEDTSKLSIQIVYRTAADRDNMLALPFGYGLNMAHDRLQQLVTKIN